MILNLGTQSIKDGIIKIDNKNGTSEDGDSHVQRLEERLQQIQKRTKMDDG